MPQSYIKSQFRRWFGRPLAIQLVEACEAVPGLRKRGENDILEFNYLKIVDLANALREELLPRGITIIPNDLECIEEIIETPEGRMIEARVKTEFIISNGWEELRLCSYGSSRSPDGFAVSAAQTFALKGLLKRMSLIFGDDDDPELPRWAHTPENTHQKKRQKEYQERAWADGVRNSGMTAEKVEALLSEAMDRPVTTEQIVAWPVKEFDWAMQILLQHSDLTNVLEMSRDQAKKEPQSAA